MKGDRLKISRKFMKKVTVVILTLMLLFLTGCNATPSDVVLDRQTTQEQTEENVYETVDVLSYLPTEQNEPENISEEVQIVMYDSWDNLENIVLRGSKGEFEVKYEDMPIPFNTYKYTQYIDLVVDYTYYNFEYTVNDWYIVDSKTGEKLGKPTDEDLDAKYDIERQYEKIVLNQFPENIYLNDLQPNTIYCFTPSELVLDYPNIYNNTTSDCILYVKHNFYDDVYWEYACPQVYIQDIESIFSCVAFEEGDDYRVMYKPATLDEMMSAAKGEIFYLSQLNQLSDEEGFDLRYVYNDLGKDVTLTITKRYDDEVSPIEVQMKPDQMIGCIWISHNFEIH